MSNTEEAPPLRFLYKDEYIVVVDKPPGMPVQPDETKDPSLLELLQKDLAVGHTGLVHRLDRPVSGLVLFALDKETLALMNAQFRDRQVVKHYHAIVEGRWIQGEVVLEHRLTHDTKAKKARVVQEGKSEAARLSVKLLAQGERYALLDVVPEGGAFHQIRAQLAAAGHAIKGDVKYGARRGERGPGTVPGSIALHAHSLEFHHPVTDQKIMVEAPPRTDGIWLPLLKLAGEAAGG
jgi:23S rRNA pseudouridine1911/1915/1917 synthase